MINFKKWIIILVIILIIIIGILIGTIYQNRGKIVYGIDEEYVEIEYELETAIRKVSNRNNYYIVKTCVNKFYTYYAAIYDIESENYIIDEETKISIENTQKQYAEVIYNMLDTRYIEFNQITKENILTKLESFNNSVVNITNMYVSEKTANMSVYIVEGKIREVVTGEISDFQIMLQIDSLNRSFSIFLQDYINEKYKSGFTEGSELDISVPDNIEKNEDNTYDYNSITDETYVSDLFNKYKEEVLYNTELAYEHLDEEYKKCRFETLENFKEYAKNNIRKNVIMQLDKYQITKYDDYTQYVCVDQNGNYYIFRETSVMNYSLILDTYTIDLPEFIESYNNAEDDEKILLNIQKVFDAINDGDYKYVYNKLDDTFKSNYFKTQESFETYIKENWFENNSVEYGSYQKNGEVFVYDIQITDAEGSEAKTISEKIVMQLLEGTNFVMSFNVE